MPAGYLISDTESGQRVGAAVFRMLRGVRGRGVRADCVSVRPSARAAGEQETDRRGEVAVSRRTLRLCFSRAPLVAAAVDACCGVCAGAVCELTV